MSDRGAVTDVSWLPVLASALHWKRRTVVFTSAQKKPKLGLQITKDVEKTESRHDDGSTAETQAPLCAVSRITGTVRVSVTS